MTILLKPKHRTPNGFRNPQRWMLYGSVGVLVVVLAPSIASLLREIDADIVVLNEVISIRRGVVG